MADNSTSADFEDVLSSVRRLVTHRTDLPAAAQPAEKLLLTPSLRVAAAPEGAPKKSPSAAARSALEDRIAELEAAVGAQSFDWEPDGSEDLKAEIPDRYVFAHSAPEGPLEPMPGFDEVQEGQADVDAADGADAEAPNAPDVSEPETTVDESAEVIAEADRAEAVETGEAIDGVSAGVAAFFQSERRRLGEDADVPQAPEDAATAEPEPETGLIETPEEPETSEVESSAELGANEADALEDPEPEEATEVHPPAEADPNEPKEEAVAAAAASEIISLLDLGPRGGASEAPQDRADTEGPAWAAPEELQAIVARIVREELQGELGERITRNVRKLVRREIHRAIMTRDFD